MKLIFKGPINSTSLGNVSVNILKELFKLNFEVSLFPTQDLIDTSVFEKDKNFEDWLKKSYENRFTSCEKKYTNFPGVAYKKLRRKTFR